MVEREQKLEDDTEWGCTHCGEVNYEYSLDENERRVCPCGGQILTIQEAFDMIIDLKLRLQSYENGILFESTRD